MSLGAKELNETRERRKDDSEDCVRWETGRTCERHTETEILIRVRAVMFKLLDNILLCLQACSFWTNNRCWAGLKNSAHCIMYKGLARKHKE